MSTVTITLYDPLFYLSASRCDTAAPTALCTATLIAIVESNTFLNSLISHSKEPLLNSKHVEKYIECNIDFLITNLFSEVGIIDC